jgi:hypothetical protein
VTRAALDELLRAMSEPGYDPVKEMLREEIALGYVPVPVGSVDWLPLSDWHPRDVVSSDGVEVRIVAIMAREPGTGAFRRLVAGIESAGLRPVIVCPLPGMTEIMGRWGWACVRIGDEVQCRPPIKNKARREALTSAGTEGPAGGSACAGGPSTRQSGEIEQRGSP